jgi:outer membrane protein TolC
MGVSGRAAVMQSGKEAKMDGLTLSRSIGAGCLTILCAGFACGGAAAKTTIPTPRIVSVAAGDEPAPPPKPTPPDQKPPGDKLPPEPPPAPVDPAALGGDVMPIDLPTALRLVDTNNPTVAVARLRFQEALFRQQQADIQWLPNLYSGPAYYRHDGEIQNSAGIVFPTNKSNLFVGGQMEARVDTADALFLPLVARRVTDAQAAAARATSQNVQLDVALAYLELLRAYEALAINGEILSKSEYMLNAANVAVNAGQSSSASDANRVRTEVELRRQERRDLEVQAATASARLTRLLALRPSVNLKPAEPAVAPVSFVDLNGDLDEMAATGLMNRPELAQSRALTAAALQRWRQARATPFLPHLDVSYSAGTFGGGQNSRVGDFAGRGDGLAQVIWELRGLGAYDVLEARERKTQFNEATAHTAEVEAQVAEEVVAAAKLARARLSTLPSGEEGVKQAEEMWRKMRDVAFMGDNKRFDPIPPVLAVQALAQARYRYLNEIIDYNQAQFRLYTAMGQPPLQALNCPPK